MSDDYQERESFLDTFCKQSVTIEKELSARRPSNIDAKKKNQLLAALKAIDSEDTVNWKQGLFNFSIHSISTKFPLLWFSLQRFKYI